eukprot:Hpha_TRINITY_DN23758_c0_g1::TRINITY_DN23758_c0_g1_i1::g.93111::m.93111/K00476/ASPH; aspartate beta-hydroxylase
MGGGKERMAKRSTAMRREREKGSWSEVGLTIRRVAVVFHVFVGLVAVGYVSVRWFLNSHLERFETMSAEAAQLLRKHGELEAARLPHDRAILEKAAGLLWEMREDRDRAGKGSSGEALSASTTLIGVLQSLPGNDEEVCRLGGVILGHPRCGEEHREVQSLLEVLQSRSPRALVPNLHSCPSRFAGPAAAACLRHNNSKAHRALYQQAIQMGVPWNDPLQLPPVFLSKISSKPWWDGKDIPIIQTLESVYSTARAELETLLLTPKGNTLFSFVDQNLVGGAGDGEWRELLIFSLSSGGWNEEACDVLPSVCQALRGRLELEGVPKGVLTLEHWSELPTKVAVLRLQRGTSLASHFGGSNLRLVSHLGLAVPEDGPELFVSKEPPRRWVEGKAIVFDDSYLHSVRWDVPEGEVREGCVGEPPWCGDRYVLACNFWHPSLKLKA